MRSHVGRHTDGDTRRTVEEQERSLRRKDGRLDLGVIEVVHHVDSVLVNVAEDVFSDLLKLGFGVSHCGDRIAVHRTEVSLAENGRIALVPVLRKPCKGIIDAGITVRMIFTQHLTHNLRALPGRPGICQSESVHSEEHTSLNRFETIPHVRERTGHDDGHRIVDVRATHLLIDLDRFYDTCLPFYNLFFVIHIQMLISLIYKHTKLSN